MPVCWPDFSETKIAFAHAGGIWSAPRSGGAATPLVQAAGGANRPRFSPDGQMLAFEADFGDGHDLWTMPSGGIPIRLTDHPHPKNLVWMDTRRRCAVLCPWHQGSPEGVADLYGQSRRWTRSNNFLSRMAPGPTSTVRGSSFTPHGRETTEAEAVSRWDGHRPLDERWCIGLPPDHVYRHRHRAHVAQRQGSFSLGQHPEPPAWPLSSRR